MSNALIVLDASTLLLTLTASVLAPLPCCAGPPPPPHIPGSQRRSWPPLASCCTACHPLLPSFLYLLSLTPFPPLPALPHSLSFSACPPSLPFFLLQSLVPCPSISALSLACQLVGRPLSRVLPRASKPTGEVSGRHSALDRLMEHLERPADEERGGERRTPVVLHPRAPLCTARASFVSPPARVGSHWSLTASQGERWWLRAEINNAAEDNDETVRLCLVFTFPHYLVPFIFHSIPLPYPPCPSLCVVVCQGRLQLHPLTPSSDRRSHALRPLHRCSQGSGGGDWRLDHWLHGARTRALRRAAPPL